MKIESLERSRRSLSGRMCAACIAAAILAGICLAVYSSGLRSAATDANESDVADVRVEDDDRTEPAGVAEVERSTPAEHRGGARTILASSTKPSATSETDRLIALAKAEIGACRTRYQTISDYVCMFHKRERIDGKLNRPHVAAMKVRTRPREIYFRFVQPNRGREAIFTPGKNGNKIVAHDVGLGRLLAGTMFLDPKGSMAMEENRHPITEAGLGALIDTVVERWAVELDPVHSSIVIHPETKVGDRTCKMIESVHPQRRPEFLFHKVKVFIDAELGLPIRFEAYDWPTVPGAEPELIEEYTYADLKTDVGLTDADFDPANPRYSFGRF